MGKTAPAINSYTFSSYKATLYVPVGSKQEYEEAEYWSSFAKIVEIGEEEMLSVHEMSMDEIKPIMAYDVIGRENPNVFGIKIIRMSNGRVKKVLMR